MNLTMLPQPVFISSKLTIETLEEGLKYVQSNNKDTRMTLNGVILVSLL